jgi:hypothetical protein
MKKKPLILVALIIMLVPIRTTTVPEWRIRYVDAKGQPIGGLPVQQTWKNYSAELTENMEIRHTDAIGYVVFPTRVAWSPLFLRLLISFKSVLNVHAGSGSSSWLTPRCDVTDSQTLTTYAGTRLPEQSTLRYFDRSGIRAALPSGVMKLPPECASIEAQVQAASR